jgi:hypothetical protein
MSANNDGYSWYHALQTRVQKRLNRAWMVMASYTFSKFMEATSYLNDCDPVPYRNISNSDRPHRAVVSFIYQPHFARGWQVQGIYQWQSGAPINFGNVAYYGGPVALPADQRTVSHWFNTAVFERSSAWQPVDNVRTFPLRFGNLRMSALNMLDLGISKNIRVRERYTLQIRADAFNAENHTIFGAPNASPTSTDFGAITSTSQLPRVIEFSLRVQF